MLEWCHANHNLQGSERLQRLRILPSSFGRRKPQIERWRKPVEGSLKLNVAVHRGNGRSASGFFLQDHAGKVVAAEGFLLSGSGMLEDEVLERATNWALALQLPNSEMEADFF
ncbi:unnamed protein product [Cuscuta europaea]|uniref:Uncharacterized protein n=1 Tax=Cuscuta europaea TaxID=41803 RepID=A0A9P0ZVD4_CUSEU|nr:unnamed protein product [Cuscuta europaea]